MKGRGCGYKQSHEEALVVLVVHESTRDTTALVILADYLEEGRDATFRPAA